MAGIIYLAAAIEAHCDETAVADTANIQPLSKSALDAANAAPDVVLGRSMMRDPKHDAETFTAFTKAAEAGNPIAQTYLGYLNYIGHGTPQNDRAAVDWFERAAHQGLVDAELRLALIYERPRDLHDPARTVTANRREALFWLEQAARQHSQLALREMGAMAVDWGLVSGRIAEARRIIEPLAREGDSWLQEDMCFTYRILHDDATQQKYWCDLSERSLATRIHGLQIDQVLESDVIPMPPGA